MNKTNDNLLPSYLKNKFARFTLNDLNKLKVDYGKSVKLPTNTKYG